jgi:hypothetical protein
MEAISSVLDALAWPVFPTEPWPQAAFVATAVLMIGGILMLAFPATSGRVLGLEGSQTRPGGIGELRPVGGFLAGHALATLMFFDQPVLPAALGAAMAVATFSRLISLMSDTSASLLNLLLFLVQAIFSVALLSYFSDVVTRELVQAIWDAVLSTFSSDVTDELQPAVSIGMMQQLVFLVFAGLTIVGFLVLFTPRIAMNIAGLWVVSDKQGGIASVRSTGGFMLGMGGFGLAMAGSWQSQFILLLMLCFGIVLALALSIIGRLLALTLNRGNLIFNIVALMVQAAAIAIVVTYVGSAM